jgi:catechol 2,3-dioxygenase-like lactoylglutathione lyase family enzyme
MARYALDHVHLRAPDPDATAAWYEGMFGAVRKARVMNGPNIRVVLDLGGLPIFIEQVPAGTAAPPSPPFLGVEHIGLMVDDMAAAVAELKAKGAVFTTEPKEVRPGVTIAFVQAPDGARVEILHRA